MEPRIDPYHTEPDLIVLDNLFKDVKNGVCGAAAPAGEKSAPEIIEEKANEIPLEREYDKETVARLKSFNDPKSPAFTPTVFVTWDERHIPAIINEYIIRPYTRIGVRIVRHPTDVVFLTHILTYLTVNLGSAVWLFYHFTWWHGVAHVAFAVYCMGPFTLMMHNHIHNGGVLAKAWAWLDLSFPYVAYPLMGHTWNSYYYHHVKHHHVEGNGPGDLSSTIRYQRDELLHFLHYLGRFMFLVWLDLPLYFLRKNKAGLAMRACAWELASYAFYYVVAKLHPRATTFVFLLPLVIMRIALMMGNWGQHAFVDELEPDSDFRSSITLIDVTSNRFSFNDGYHTAHHLNPLRHWREQPVHFIQAKEAYRAGRALVFHNIDYFMMTVTLLRKDYKHLASCLVPMGDQIGMSQVEIAEMLKTKTRKFSEEDIKKKFK
ncbi:hypothetical protein BAUCODRAFT_74402 [Baudoinia panamericana UAMH 10762]|uniref:Fatty acid desaturase domain-containing protein n=1 Tax=Baudoinia panamericana (strain UAMH 10762) TaxID=717646 RepID=M2N5H6_BAUPA|nr:uncharacterized protein BAUCODRAFT_74402 [Baudoinia panamericana UAMH 10762]EMC94299.1 hypothetical protein BAUCODRAFT_74402 [Baudoinia panamericana UAMH 10762]